MAGIWAMAVIKAGKDEDEIMVILLDENGKTGKHD
jgi:hypothetical protein